MPLVNVRLDAEDARRARALRAEGVRISTLVRAALRQEFERRAEARSRRRKPSALVAEIIERFPDDRPTNYRGPRLDDRRAVREHIVARLRRSR
jgi:post-segregation antitoxin (ccd killing protein)